MRINLDCHNAAERFFDRRNTAAAIVAIGALVVLGTVAASFDLSQGGGRLLAVGLSLLAAVATVLQAVRDYGSKASSHKAAARQYGALRREIELAAMHPDGSTDQNDVIVEIRTKWDWTAEIADNVPERIRTKGKAKARPPHAV